MFFVIGSRRRKRKLWPHFTTGKGAHMPHLRLKHNIDLVDSCTSFFRAVIPLDITKVQEDELLRNILCDIYTGVTIARYPAQSDACVSYASTLFVCQLFNNMRHIYSNQAIMAIVRRALSERMTACFALVDIHIPDIKHQEAGAGGRPSGKHGPQKGPTPIPTPIPTPKEFGLPTKSTIIKALRKDGWEFKTTAARFNITTRLLKQLMKQHKISSTPYGVLNDVDHNIERENVIRALDQGGWNCKKVADNYGVGVGTIRLFMSKHGITKGTHRYEP